MNASVKVTPTQPQISAWQHGEIWEGVQDLAIELGAAHWYGGGGLVHQQYPLEKTAMYSAPFITSDNGHTGLLGILESFWWNSDGFGVWVENDALTMSFNAPLTGTAPLHSFTTPAPNEIRPAFAADVTGDGLLRLQGENLRVRFFQCPNAKEVVEAFWSLLTLSSPPPNPIFEHPLWTTWAHFKNDISYAKIHEYLQQLEAHGFTASIFGTDAKWQHQFGDTRFDLQKFPDPAQLIDEIHALGAEATLWCVPFYMEDSMHFEPATTQGYTLRNLDGTPYIGTWWEGNAAFLDVTNPTAMQWHLDNLQALADEVDVDSFKFDAGEAMFFQQPNTLRHNQDAANCATHWYVKQVAERFPWSDMRSGWRNQAQTMLFRQWDKTTRWDYANGLASCITQAITLSMLGYRFSFPDMIGGNQYAGVNVDAELLIRWTQAVAPMPIMQFSVPPWEHGEECTRICQRYAQLHGELAPRVIQLSEKHVPIVRPLWWLTPQDEIAQTCADQYLIGDDLLVAPVIEQGAGSRNVYLPWGTWRSYWDANEVHQGGQWLMDYPAPLDVLPLFVKV